MTTIAPDREVLTGLRGSGKTYKALMRLWGAAEKTLDGKFLFVSRELPPPSTLRDVLSEHNLSYDHVRAKSHIGVWLEFDRGSRMEFCGANAVCRLAGKRFDGIVADATECWANRETSIDQLEMLLKPDGFFIETRCE